MIATSKDQGERLISAGLKTTTADLAFVFVDYNGRRQGTYLPMSALINAASIIYSAWSLSALWDITTKLADTFVFDTKMSAQELLDILVETICERLTSKRQ